MTIQTSPAMSMSMHVKIAYMGTQLNSLLEELGTQFSIHRDLTIDKLTQHLDEQSLLNLPDIIIMEVDESETCFEFVEKLKKTPLLQGLIIILLSTEKREEWKLKALELKVHDYYT